METYFNIRYEFNIDTIHGVIEQTLKSGEPSYICVADGNILAMVQRDRAYWQVVYDSLFSICDSSWVPLYLYFIYGIQRRQYCGAQIFKDIVSKGKYHMAFLGTDNTTLNNLKSCTTRWNPQTDNMPFIPLPFSSIDDFDYKFIATRINKENVDIIWVALGAPKQEIFMNRLRPHLKRGVMIGVGAVFNYYSGRVKRAPRWMVACRLEFAYRLLTEPGKQWNRCKGILATLSFIFHMEKERKLIARLSSQLRTLKSPRVSFDNMEVITAFGQSPSQLDALLITCATHPETHFTIISDDARFWKTTSNVSVLPVPSNFKIPEYS